MIVNPFSFSGPIGRGPYIAWILPLLFLPHLFVWLVAKANGFAIPFDSIEFGIFPLRSLISDAYGLVVFDNMPRRTRIELPHSLMIAGFVVLLVQAWGMVALSYRRVLDARVDAWLSAAVIAPVIQFPAVLYLCLINHGDVSPEAPVEAAERNRLMSGWSGGLKGLLAGMAVTLGGVATSALVFGSYGYGIFLLSPLLMGALTAFFANDKRDITVRETKNLVMLTSIVGGIALVAVALEGFGCLIMAAPLGIGMALLGGMLGRAMARTGEFTGGQMASSVALLPLVFALEAAFPPAAHFDTMQTIDIQAPAEKVWKAIVQMETIEEPVSLLHHAGVAYPMRGRVFGAGGGALRYGDFSTGTAIERVTEWQENRKLAFVVLKDIAGLRELSPYRHVHAPHVNGYFKTRETSFELVPLEGGITRIVERTSHELKLDPALYWLPFARHMVDTNNARVLRHIKRQAERSVVATNLSARSREDADAEPGAPGFPPSRE